MVSRWERWSGFDAMVNHKIVFLFFTVLYSPSTLAIDWRGEFIGEGRKFQLRNEFVDSGYHNEEFKSVLNIGLSHYVNDIQLNFEGGARYFNQIEGLEENSEGYANQLYADKYIGKHLFSLGRKNVRWGVGFVSSPTDIVTVPVSPLNPEDRFYEIEGRDLLQYSWLGAASSVDLLFVKGQENAVHLESNALYWRYYANKNNIDLALIGGVPTENDGYVIGGNITSSLGQALELHLELIYNSQQRGREPIFNELGEIVFSEDEQIRALLGGQWSTDGGFNIVFEYLYLQDGLSKQGIANIVNLSRQGAVVNALSIATGLLQTHYIFLRFGKDDVLGNWDNSLVYFASAESASSVYKYEISRTFDSGVSVYGEFLQFSDDDNGEFALARAEYLVNLGLKYVF